MRLILILPVLDSNTTGNYNTANGNYSLGYNTTGSYNLAMGSDAGRYAANPSEVANTTGNNSIFLGYYARANANNQTNQIVIGSNATGIGSNSVVLGSDSIVTTALKGNIGIGTTSPYLNFKLDVVGQTNGVHAIAPGFAIFGEAGTTGTGVYGYGVPGVAGSPSAINGYGVHGLNMFTNGTGSAVYGQSSGTATGVKGESSHGIGGYFSTFDGYALITGSGNVGIGTASPNYTLHVNGSVAGIGAYNSLSDRRFKKDIKPITSALDKILAIDGISFNWDTSLNSDLKVDNKNHLGFIAQDIEKILPQAVSTANDKLQTKSVSYSEVIPVLVEAIKEQQKEIDGLKQTINTLRTKK